MKKQLSLFSTALALVSSSALAEQFDLRKGVNPNADVTFVDAKMEPTTPKVFVAKVKKGSLAKQETTFVGTGPFKYVDARLDVGNDNVAGRVGKDTGRTFGIAMSGTVSNGSDQDVVVTFSSNLFTKRNGPKYSIGDGRINVAVDSTEQNRVSVKTLKFKDGYYVIAGVGAEHLSNNGAIAKTLQDAYHNVGFTKKEFTYNKNSDGPEALSVDAQIGVGKEIVGKAGPIEVFFVPQVVAQVSTASRNNQIQARATGGVRAGGTTVSAYGEYALNPSVDGKLVGLRVEQNLMGRKGNETALFVAIERREDAFDKWYGTQNAENKHRYFRLGIVKKLNGGARQSTVSSQN